MISASNGSGTLGQYSYDGDGKRVKKYVPSTGELTVFVYDASGKTVAEYSTIVAAPQDAKVNYLTADHLGSPRINTDQNGNVIARHDHMPFGEEIDGAGGRTAGLNYGDDTVRKQFTGYERDKETILDFAKARYFKSDFGRFSSPDPFLPSARPGLPQTFNRYAYVINNPLVLRDPSGLDWIRTADLDKNGNYTYKDLYGKELKKALAGKQFVRVDFHGAENRIIVRNGKAVFEMLAKGGGREIKETPIVPGPAFNPVRALTNAVTSDPRFKILQGIHRAASPDAISVSGQVPVIGVGGSLFITKDLDYGYTVSGGVNPSDFSTENPSLFSVKRFLGNFQAGATYILESDVTPPGRRSFFTGDGFTTTACYKVCAGYVISNSGPDARTGLYLGVGSPSMPSMNVSRGYHVGNLLQDIDPSREP